MFLTNVCILCIAGGESVEIIFSSVVVFAGRFCIGPLGLFVVSWVSWNIVHMGIVCGRLSPLLLGVYGRKGIGLSEIGKPLVQW